jgi:hypothetical protein
MFFFLIHLGRTRIFLNVLFAFLLPSLPQRRRRKRTKKNYDARKNDKIKSLSVRSRFSRFHHHFNDALAEIFMCSLAGSVNWTKIYFLMIEDSKKAEPARRMQSGEKKDEKNEKSFQK